MYIIKHPISKALAKILAVVKTNLDKTSTKSWKIVSVTL